MDSFARKPADERLAFFQEAANRRDLSSIIIEKDFWVCWTMRRLTEHPDLGLHLIFKGGTSLSKAYGIIERFSEDIDLTIGHAAPLIRETLSPMEPGISRNEVERRADSLKRAAQRYVADVALPAINKVVAAALGNDEGWRVVLDSEDHDNQTVLFYYPRVFNYGVESGRGGLNENPVNTAAVNSGAVGYIRPHIKLEFGARGEPDPNEPRTITPYVAQTFPDAFDDFGTSFATLAAERTFWEKATILHALHHGSKLRERMSRHYYDTYMLAEKGVAVSAMKNPALLASVVRNKTLLFRDAKASYSTAVIGSLKLLPIDDAMPGLRKDYEAMREMFMGDTIEFNTIMRLLENLEKAVNEI